MDISPLEIQKKEFNRSLRGYNREEVHEFLDRVTVSYEKIYKENKDLEEDINNLKEQLKAYKELEITLKNTLVVAEKTAEEVKKNAIRERNSILKEAMVKAQDILNRAEHKYSSSNDKIEELRRQFYLYKTRSKNFIQSQIDFLDSFELEVFDDDNIFETFEAAAGRDIEEDVDENLDENNDDVEEETSNFEEADEVNEESELDQQKEW